MPLCPLTLHLQADELPSFDDTPGNSTMKLQSFWWPSLETTSSINPGKNLVPHLRHRLSDREGPCEIQGPTALLLQNKSLEGRGNKSLESRGYFLQPLKLNFSCKVVKLRLMCGQSQYFKTPPGLASTSDTEKGKLKAVALPLQVHLYLWPQPISL